MVRLKLWWALLLALTTVMASEARADDWYLVETDNFLLYSYDDEADTKAFARDLERLDQVMRILTGIGPAREPSPSYNKVTVFRFGEGKDIGRLAGSRWVGGFFIPRAGQPVAFVPKTATKVRGLGQKASGLELDPTGVLYHEYAHYFMYRHAPAAYPAWYSEGFAELFYTIDLGDDRFTIGEPPASRAYSLGTMRPETRKMFGSKEGDDVDRIESERVYGHGWLLSSHLLLDPRRSGQLSRYLTLLNQGRNSRSAAEEVFGDLDALDAELDAYRRSNARILHIPYYDTSEPRLSVRRLTDAETEVIRMVAQSNAGVTEKEARGQLSQARSAVEKYPESVPVLLAATEVEFDNDNFDEAERLANAALAIDSDSMGAALYRARVSLARGAKDAAHYDEARLRFAAANRIDNDDPRALNGYYLAHILDDREINDSVALALEAAHREATYDRSIRRTLAHLLMNEGRRDEAFVVMTPLMNDPHSKDGQEMMALFRSEKDEDRAKLMEMLAPRPHGWEPPEDE
ncbi:hypothetical protein WJT74_02180 [Sphingomicrobium sp. XHP0239]|uniref:tetratricopeptide repeat protein n=1 Tax=Sphingomicrobium maritimum TaxID=3133972 RepID=UPI0031CC74C1